MAGEGPISLAGEDARRHASGRLELALHHTSAGAALT